MKNLGVEKTFRVVGYLEFEEFVQNHYQNKEYSFVCSEEANNYSTKNFDIPHMKELDSYDKDLIETFKSKKKDEISTYILLQDLVNNQIIPVGNYLIEVFW